MLLLHHGPLSPQRSLLDLEGYIAGMREVGGLDDHLIVMPTGRRLSEIERSLTLRQSKEKGEPLVGLPLYTVGSFVSELYRHIAPGRRDATKEIQIALVERAMKRVDLGYFGRPGRNPSLGVVEEVTRVISGVRADGIQPSDFAADLELIEKGSPKAEQFDSAKLRDLYNIYSEYLRLLGDTWVDHPGRMIRVNTKLFEDPDDLMGRAFPGRTVLLLHEHTEFTWPEIDMLVHLARITDLSIWIAFDYAKGNGPLYGNFEEVISRLVTGGYRTTQLDPIDPEVPKQERRPFTHHMRRNLFRTDERIENDAFDERISVYSFRTRDEEVRGIAGLLKSIIVNRIAPAERICVATRSMEEYTDLFREHLPSYGVPAVVTARHRLEQNGMITALFSALNIVATNYSRRDVIRAVTSPYLSFGSDVDAAALADVAKKLRITRGLGTWRRRIARRIAFIETRKTTTGDADEQRTLDIERRTLQRAADSIEGVHRAVADFERTMTPTAFRRAFLDLAGRLGVPRNALALRGSLDRRNQTPADRLRIHDEMERDTRALARFLGLLDELTELFALDGEIEEESEGISGEGDAGQEEREDKPDADHEDPEEQTEEESDSADADREEFARPLRWYLDHVRTAAARSYYGIREKHDYGVLVTTIDQLQGLDFDVVILCGMVDGEFPSRYLPINFLGKPLEKTEERQLRRERVDFYTGLTASRDRIFLTWPRTEAESELVRSSFVDALLRITTVAESGNCIDYGELRYEREMRRGGTDPLRDFPAVIASPGELAEEVGRVLWAGGEVPRFEEDTGVIDALRHTAAVEIGRHEAESVDSTDEVPEYRGIIGGAIDDEARAELRKRRDREYSVSQLETYAACPFKYFARRLLNVDAPSRYDVTLTPLERGILVHTILYRLYVELRSEDRLPITADDRDAVLELAREIAAEEIEEIDLDHPFWRIDRERLLGGGPLIGLIEEWIDAEITRTEQTTDFVPAFFEVGFGRTAQFGETDPLLGRTEEIEAYSIKVRGKVDRVEILRRDDEILYVVADYKTGKPPDAWRLEQGLSLQLLVYLEVLRDILADHFDLPREKVRPAGGVYYQLQAGKVAVREEWRFLPAELRNSVAARYRGSRKGKIDPDTIDELEDRIAIAFDQASTVIDGISEGRYHLTTHDVSKVCRGCEYMAACRVSSKTS